MKNFLCIAALLCTVSASFAQEDKSERAFLEKAEQISFKTYIDSTDLNTLLTFNEAIESIALRAYNSEQEELSLRRLHILIRSAKYEPWYLTYVTQRSDAQSRSLSLLEELGSSENPDFGTYRRRTFFDFMYDIGMGHGLRRDEIGKRKYKSSYIPMWDMLVMAKFYPDAENLSGRSIGFGSGVIMMLNDTTLTQYVPVKLVLGGTFTNSNSIDVEASYLINLYNTGKNLFGYGLILNSDPIKVGIQLYVTKKSSIFTFEVRYNLRWIVRKPSY
jgi:hypothetical protein